MLDVQQIFGRAGRPQFEDEGLGIIITQHAQLAHYLGMLTHQAPIESKFTDPLVDNLNAEIVLGKSSPDALNLLLFAKFRHTGCFKAATATDAGVEPCGSSMCNHVQHYHVR